MRVQLCLMTPAAHAPPHPPPTCACVKNNNNNNNNNQQKPNTQFAAGSGAAYVFGATLGGNRSELGNLTNFEIFDALFGIDPLPDVLSLSALCVFRVVCVSVSWRACVRALS